MGLWEFLQQWRNGRIFAGIVASVLLHVGLAALVLLAVRMPPPKWLPPPGDALIVEFPNEPVGAGKPSAAASLPAGAPTPPAPKREAARPTPVARREVAPARREERRPPSVVEKQPARSAEPATRTPEPSPTPTPSAAEADARSAVAKPEDARPTESTPSPAPGRDGAERQVAMVPPGGPASGTPDTRSALRRGGGGDGEGRGGILGAEVPLDTPDPKFHEFLDQVRRQIQDKLNYPCVKDRDTFGCEPKNTRVVIHFGILKTGRIQYVEVAWSSPWSIYDTAAMTAIRLAQPFPPVPPAIMATLPVGSTGIPIAGNFHFTVHTSTIVR
jgi:TonB family protein